MKKEDIEMIIARVKEVKRIGDQQTYNLSTAINQNLMKVFPLLENELDRMNNEKITINCPALLLIGAEGEIKDINELTNRLNNKMQELVMNDFKIIDFGLCGNSSLMAYIKYTS